MSRMDYYSNELEDDFIEIDDTISNEEYHYNKSKKENKEDKTPCTPIWEAYTVNPYFYSQQCQSIRDTIDAQQCNAYRQDLRTLANTCQTQQIITNPINFIQQQLNTDLEASLFRIEYLKEKYLQRQQAKNFSKIMED